MDSDSFGLGKGRVGEWILQQNLGNGVAAPMGAALFTTGPYIDMVSLFN